MDRSPQRGLRGAGGGGGGSGGRRGGGGGGGRDNERYGGRATDPYHSSRKRSRSRSPENRNHRDHYREGDGRGEREYPKRGGGRGPDREHRVGGPLRKGGRDHDAPPERERPALPERGDRDREYTSLNARGGDKGDKGGRNGSGRDDYDKSRRYRSRSRDRHTADRRRGRSRSRERDSRRTDGARSRSRERHNRERARRGGGPSQPNPHIDIDASISNPRSDGRRTISPSNNKSAAQSPPSAQDTEMAGTEIGDVAVEDDTEAQMQAMMGIGGFGTTKQKKVKGNNVGAISKNKTTTYRQYMNRPGGFNRALSPS